MLLVFEYSQGYGREFVRIRSGMFPNRRTPSHSTCIVERRLQETARFAPKSVDYGSRGFVRILHVEEQTLKHVGEDPELSTRGICRKIGVSKDH